MREEDFFIVVEQMTELIGGLASIQQKIQYPELAMRANIQGRVYLQFIMVRSKTQLYFGELAVVAMKKHFV
ncbi:hypothetical protein BH23BAC3_BH23BAC3_00020 [soil metagenome]